MVWINLLIVGSLFTAATGILYQAEKQTKFRDYSYKKKQCLIGICFGLLAVVSTENGVQYQGAVINIRDAAPLIAGLIFGGPAGMIAGVIGGVERWFAVYWGIGTYTRVACSLATLCCGVFAAMVRKFLLDNKKPSFVYALAVAITMEVLHMLLVFLTNMSDIQTAFTVVKQCALPMIIVNGAVVMVSTIVVTILGKEKIEKLSDTKKLSQTFQLWLFVCVFIGFMVTSQFTYILQTRIAASDTEKLLTLNLNDVKQDILDASDQNLLMITKLLSDKISENPDYVELNRLAREYNVSEINIIDENGIIQASTYIGFIGFDMASGPQSAEFLALLNGETEYVQPYQPTSYDPNIYRKYGAVTLPEGGFLQVGFNASRFQKDIDDEVTYAARNRHIGQKGSIIICDESFQVISDREGYTGQSLNLANIIDDRTQLKEFVPFKAEVHGVLSYCAFTVAEGYYIISVIPYVEAMFSRDIAVYLIIFMEILVFAAIFAYIYFLIKELIVSNIWKINQSLAKITGGDLNVTVDVRSNEEFASLSDDINATVVTLKRYIDEAETRIDQELEYARNIQRSALPSVFPPYPNRKEFDIYATMDPAKEVGGDFYDFYLLDENRLAFLIADVSGKGIPAAMFMMKAKALIKSLVESGLDLAEAFVQANDELCEGNDAEMFVTVWMGVLDLKSGIVEFINAGHNPPVIKRRGEQFEYLRSKANLVLGMMDGMPYKKHETVLNPGDTIFLYTDGAPEAHDPNDELFGEERLLDCLRSVGNVSMKEICRKVDEELKLFVKDAEQFDDITMLAFHRNEES